MCPFLLFSLRLFFTVAGKVRFDIYSFFLLALFYIMSKIFSLIALLRADYSLIVLAVVENNGFEPLTPCVQGRCSSQLS